MGTYNSWPVIGMPAEPAPKSVEISVQNIVGISENPFTGQQQIQNWNANYLELTVTLPPMKQADAATWVTFFVACQGMANVFQISNATWEGLIPAGVNAGGYWRMKTNTQKFSINDGIVFGFAFDIREAI